MARTHSGGVVRLIQRLWDSGTAASLDDATLLGSFLRRDAIAEEAFAALVRRHAPMVLRVCRDVTGDSHDAEDAAQVTFLVLARKADSIRRGETLANWLFGTARRVAARRVRDAARRRHHERRFAESAVVRPRAEESAQGREEARARLYEELDRLPMRYRDPIVLCDLQGLTHDQAAAAVGCPLRTLQTRLYRGRQRLRERLDRRGLTSAMGAVGSPLQAATVPTAWATATTAGAMSLATGGDLPNVVAESVSHLFRGVKRSMLLSRLKSIAAVLVLVGFTAGLTFALAPGAPGGRQASTGPGKTPQARPAAENQKSTPPAPMTSPITVRGRTTDHQGKPVAGATIYLVSTNGQDAPLGTTTTDRDGSYVFQNARLPVSRWGAEDSPLQGTFQVYGTALGHGFAWHGMRCYQPRRRPEDWGKVVGGDYNLFGEDPKVMDLQFPPAASLAGSVIDEKGRPISGARIKIGGCDFLDTQGKETHHNFREFWSIFTAPASLTTTTTGPDGRFRLVGLPREAGFRIYVEHPDHAWMDLYAATTDRPTSAFEFPRGSVAGNVRPPVATGEIRVTLRSTRRIAVRTVFDDTGQPAKKVSVSAGTGSSGSSSYGISDAAGKLQLRLPPGDYEFTADPTEGGAECLRTRANFRVVEWQDEQALEVRVKPACVVILEAVDAKTGRGIPGVQFDAEPDPMGRIGGRMSVQSRPGYIDNPRSDANGRLRAVVEPGKWVYLVGHIPESAGYRQQYPERRVDLPARGTVTIRFKLQQ